ncbi:glycosyltransferase family 4 protein [Aquihabitans sp. G128]|uniref:glycosyltransferase family 4 protein n=1 Tax=Aquihabitans sp. G128 TaxID=2849779 RepID=UPI001C23CF17|nr:glycosyltransferase family 4 protein [Aquihabitans sp. G128]QXC60259.1 glycosyltransferase family 4 protein [Aquihabitans sp. G128]
MTRPTAWVLLHDLERTGVPIALARLARWQATADAGSPALDLHVVAGRDGPVRIDLERSGAAVVALGPRVGRTLAGTVAAGLAQSGRAPSAAAVRGIEWRRRLRPLPSPDVVLVQGAGAWALWQAVRPALPAGCRTVVHLHELAVALSRSLPTDALAPLLHAADRVLAVCAPVADLARAAGAERVELVPGTAEEPVPGPTPAPGSRPGSLAGPVLLGMGAPSWRKGTDRFVAVAHELRRRHPEVASRWIGGAPSGSEAWAVGADLATAWDPPTDAPWDDVGPPAVLAITSREDPLPLVALEAGLRGIAVVATPTGGLPALLADGRGLVVDGWDLPAFAAAVGRCFEDPGATEARTAALRRHVAAHHAAAVVGPRWLAALLG